MRIVVTGGTGLLGTALAHKLSQSHELYLLSDASVVKYGNCSSLKADICNPAALKAAFDSAKPDAIIHTAALTNVDYCEDHHAEADALNATAPANAAAYCKAKDIRLVHVSTDFVFDGKKPGGMYVETDETNPANYYSVSKFNGENAVVAAGGNFAAVRTTMYGLNVRGKKNYAMMFYESFSAGTPFKAFSNQFNTPMLANDLAAVISELVVSDATGIFHCGAPDRVNRVQFATQMAETFGFDKALIEPVELKDGMLAANRPRDVSLNSSKLEKTLGRKIPTLKEGIARFKQLKESDYESKFEVLKG
jgi:dTDP-4-dehydrorhamnose reductase